jgi:hypothetical protein
LVAAASQQQGDEEESDQDNSLSHALLRSTRKTEDDGPFEEFRTKYRYAPEALQ